MTVHRERRPTPEPIFPKLPGGAGAPPPDRVAAHQRARLMGAMVEGVHRSGYQQLTIRELVGLAGVSRTSFYEHFTGKEECFLATLGEIATRGVQWVEEGRGSAAGLPGVLENGLRAFAEIVVAEPLAARLALVDSLSLGPAGVPGREAAADHFEPLITGSFAAAGRPLGRLQARWILSGWRHAAYRALRAGEPARLEAELSELVTWALARPDAEGVAVPSLPASVRRGQPGWSRPIRSARTRPAPDRRPRLLQAAAQLAAADGSAALSIPAITKRALTSNVAFYEHFDSTEEALLLAFDDLCATSRGLTATAFAAQPDWPGGVLAALAALLLHVSREPIFARLAFFELPASGPGGLDRADAGLGTLEDLLRPAAFGSSAPALSSAARAATVGALWAAIQQELAGGRASSLPGLAGRLGALVLAPFRA
ncbi:MAG TPA: TetR/AcrR family transcriptional regulator [Solirubrobacterales bacterium]|jgi:AcrR family transcriptional regulator|nr:TetR/AcrR family transcriptional regulator [Solirubrobacterales bacterium]